MYVRVLACKKPFEEKGFEEKSFHYTLHYTLFIGSLGLGEEKNLG